MIWFNQKANLLQLVSKFESTHDIYFSMYMSNPSQKKKREEENQLYFNDFNKLYKFLKKFKPHLPEITQNPG